MSISTRWAVSQEHDVDAPITATAIDAWADAACRAYLDRCEMLESTRADAGLELRVLGTAAAPTPLTPAPHIVVTASATEVLPRAFVLAVRLRTLGGNDDQVLNLTREVRLVDPATGERRELGNDIRDELIAIELAARYFN